MKNALDESLAGGFIPMSKIAVLIDSNHPLMLEGYTDPSEISEEIVIDFTQGTFEEKKNILEQIQGKEVYSDLTCYNPNQLPEVKGSFSCVFLTEKKKVEFYGDQKKQIKEFFEQMGLELFPLSFQSTGFVYPRTFVQIVNEAYFALSEKVASREDIDRAMKFGVNYPFGPFEWSQGKEKFVKQLLTTLKEETGDARYEVCPLIN
jgi:3-hydroxybutyryl-CoA dehydrogenase